MLILTHCFVGGSLAFADRGVMPAAHKLNADGLTPSSSPGRSGRVLLRLLHSQCWVMVLWVRVFSPITVCRLKGEISLTSTRHTICEAGQTVATLSSAGRHSRAMNKVDYFSSCCRYPLRPSRNRSTSSLFPSLCTPCFPSMKRQNARRVLPRHNARVLHVAARKLR